MKLKTKNVFVIRKKMFSAARTRTWDPLAKAEYPNLLSYSGILVIRSASNLFIYNYVVDLC